MVKIQFFTSALLILMFNTIEKHFPQLIAIFFNSFAGSFLRSVLNQLFRMLYLLSPDHFSNMFKISENLIMNLFVPIKIRCSLFSSIECLMNKLQHEDGLILKRTFSGISFFLLFLLYLSFSL